MSGNKKIAKPPKKKNISNTPKKENNGFKQMLRAFIPKNISNRVVVNAFSFLRGLQKLNRRNYSVHIEANRESIKNHAEVIRKAQGYIEDQRNYTDILFGKVNMQISGCEIFATYNALHNIHGHSPIELPDMIKEYEKDGMVLSGAFGTAPKAIRDYLKRHGYSTVFTMKVKEFDRVGEENDTLILTMYNNGMNIMDQVHTVCISIDNGKYTAHNVYCNGTVVGPYSSVTELIANINRGRAKGISLIGIKKPDCS